MYPAHLVLGRDPDIDRRLDDILEWLARRHIEPGSFRFHMAADHVRMQMVFAVLSDATAFAQTFGGHVTNRPG